MIRLQNVKAVARPSSEGPIENIAKAPAANVHIASVTDQKRNRRGYGVKESGNEISRAIESALEMELIYSKLKARGEHNMAAAFASGHLLESYRNLTLLIMTSSITSPEFRSAYARAIAAKPRALRVRTKIEKLWYALEGEGVEERSRSEIIAKRLNLSKSVVNYHIAEMKLRQKSKT